MKIMVRDSVQTMQRVKVGVIGLAAVLLLIGLAATIFAIVSREQPVPRSARRKADVVGQPDDVERRGAGRGADQRAARRTRRRAGRVADAAAKP